MFCISMMHLFINTRVIVLIIHATYCVGIHPAERSAEMRLRDIAETT